MIRRAFEGLVLASLCTTLLAQQNPSERVQRFAMLPQWSGIWETELSAQLSAGELDKAMAEASKHPERITAILAPKGALQPAEIAFFSLVQLNGKPPYNEEWNRRYERLKAKIRSAPASVIKPGSVKACSWEGSRLSGGQLRDHYG